MGRANVAAAYMEHLCECSKHGYSQQQRWGDKNLGICKAEAEGSAASFYAGDRDCSSAIIDAWCEALAGTVHADALRNATYTGNMRSIFVGTGLFEWKPMSFIAQRGDIYLNEANHTAMCVSAAPDMLAEFTVSETGGVTGKSGDQTGRESYVHGYYDFRPGGWDGILHYNGQADSGSGIPAATTATAAPQPSATKKKAKPKKVKFRIYTSEEEWLPEGQQPMRGHWIKRIAIDLEGHGWYQVRVRKPDGTHDWVEPVYKYDINDDEYGYAGWNDYEIVAIRVYYDTPEPEKTGYLRAKYRASAVKADWWPWQYDNEVDSNQDGYAGDDVPIDRFEVSLAA